jgi:hypothetical protein
MAEVVDGKIIWSDDDCCGDGWFQTSLRDPFLWACRWHDLSYQFHKASKQKTRATIDSEFLVKMLNIAKRKRSLRLKARAYVFYSLVRLFGWKAWNEKGNAI